MSNMGWTTEELTSLRDIVTERDRLRTVNAELLEALTYIERTTKSSELEGIARAAIAKAKP